MKGAPTIIRTTELQEIPMSGSEGSTRRAEFRACATSVWACLPIDDPVRDGSSRPVSSRSSRAPCSQGAVGKFLALYEMATILLENLSQHHAADGLGRESATVIVWVEGWRDQTCPAVAF